jgi:hypothetical protein
MTIAELNTTLLSESDVSSGGTFCWMSPELLDTSRPGSGGRPTRESDCYALGMVIYEVGQSYSSQWSLINPPQVLTGLRPFHHLSSYSPVLAVARGERPEKPRDAGSLGFSDRLWELVQWCWSESSPARPTALELHDYLSYVSPTWVPPPVYPTSIDAYSTTDSDSSSSLWMSLVTS